jgi:hypothetical protein
MMKIKIGYKKKNGETAGAVITIDEEGQIYSVEPKTETRRRNLPDYEEGSAVFLGVDEDDI